MQDHAIVELFFQRNEAAISESQTKYGGYCYQIAHNILSVHEDSEECVSDTWMNAWNAMPPQRPKYLRLFFARITRNLAFDRYRMSRAKKRGGGVMDTVLWELSQCIPAEGDAATEAEYHALLEVITKYLAGLPERDRKIFLRRYFYTEPIERIAKSCHLTANNVSVILSRIRAGLRVQLTKEGFLV